MPTMLHQPSALLSRAVRACALALAALCICANVRAADPQQPAARKENLFLWEGFERDPAAAGWSIDEADDPGRLSQDREHATQGSASLRIEAQFKAKGRVLVRRSSRLKLQGLRAVLADVRSAEADLQVSFAYKDTGGGWHEGPRIKLVKGDNLNVGCTVEELKKSVVAAPYFGSPDEVDEFYVVVHAGAAKAATANLDNLRFEGEPTEDWNRTAPANIELYQPERGVERYSKFELGVQFEGATGNMFDTADVSVEAAFTPPEGEPQTVRGFFAGYADSERFGRAWPIFLVRFAPLKIGRWTYQVLVRNQQGESRSLKCWFYVTDSRSSGFIQVSRKDTHYFEFSSGAFYYPIGQNVAWTQDYDSYLKSQKETGQNWVRIWLCPWNLEIEKQAGVYDLEAAARLDRIVQMAEECGVRIQLVLNYHGMVTGENWQKNPYNWANGGPCHLPSQFFSDERARELFKRRLDYVVSRWGHSTAIFAWELFNEVDICEYSTFNDVVEWHREMSDYLHKTDPNKHLVTTSLHKDATRADIWNLPNIDFIQAHVYEQDIKKAVLDLYLKTLDFKKPFFVGEYGRGSSPSQAQLDPEGRDLRVAIWSSFMLPVAGSAMPWWWDSYIRPHKLERLFTPLARFAEGTDRRLENYRLIETAILRSDGAEISVRGLLNSHSCYLWLHRSGERPVQTDAVLVPLGQKMALSGMLGGKYRMTVMETATGKELLRSALTCERGKLLLELPESKDEVAVKVEYQGSPTPEFFTSPELLQLEAKPQPK